MNEKPLKKLTINNPLPSFIFTIIIIFIIFELSALIPIIDAIDKIHASNHQVELSFMLWSLFLSFLMAGVVFCRVNYAYKSNIYYVSDILMKKDSFDIVYNKGFKIVNVQNIKISEIQDLKVEVDFIPISPWDKKYYHIKFIVSIYPKDGTEVIKFSSGYSFLNEKTSIKTVSKYLYDIIKHFRAFDFFHIEFLNEGGYTRKEFEYFLEHGKKTLESKLRPIKEAALIIVILIASFLSIIFITLFIAICLI